MVYVIELIRNFLSFFTLTLFLLCSKLKSISADKKYYTAGQSIMWRLSCSWST